MVTPRWIGWQCQCNSTTITFVHVGTTTAPTMKLSPTISNAPSIDPTLSSAPSDTGPNDCSGCNGDCVDVDLSITGDSWPYETGITLSNLYTVDVFWDAPTGTCTVPGETHYYTAYKPCQSSC